ncbi:MAG TPA: UbiA family prenyltransferase [Roseiflexaceae bacterium]|nr:UbiA family prenyltransferase [Roseiflexaceae bacterium]
MSALLRCLRPHQWCKNLLVALPLLAAHRLTDGEAWLAVALAFASFSLGASAMYVLNDLRDRDADRQHPHKSQRPIASGEVSQGQALGMFTICLLGSALIALLLLPRAFLACLIAYLVITTAYSMGLKRMLMIDVLTLAALYALRMLAGGAAVDVRISPWLLAFSMFLFLSIAFVKRYAELRAIDLARDGRGDGAPGRAYQVGDLDLIRTLGPTSGYMAAMIFALYLNSPDAQLLYPRVDWLWLICPLLIYWITRLWFAAQRGEMHHDPVIFALRNPASYVVGALTLLVAAMASMAP